MGLPFLFVEDTMPSTEFLIFAGLWFLILHGLIIMLRYAYQDEEIVEEIIKNKQENTEDFLTFKDEARVVYSPKDEAEVVDDKFSTS